MKTPGRKRLDQSKPAGGNRRNLSLTDADMLTAAAIGEGNASRGIRKAIKFYEDHKMQTKITRVFNVPESAKFCAAHALMGGWANTFLFAAEQFFAHDEDFPNEAIPAPLVAAAAEAGFWREEVFEGRVVLRHANDSDFLMVHCHDPVLQQ